MKQTSIHTKGPFYGRLSRWLSFCLVMVLAGPALGAQLTAEVGRQTISITDQLTVTFQLRGAQSTPDFGPLARDFEILGRSRSRQTRIINSRKDSYDQWQLRLAPKRQGQLTIPAISAGNAQSDPIEITVTEAPASPEETDADVFMQLSANRDSVYVQQQLLVTAKLYSKYDWRDKKIEDFELDNAQIEAVAENEYVTQVGGTPHVVYELTFAVYPQQSGTFTVPALQFAAELQTQRRSLFSSGSVRRGRSQPLSVEVKPSPADAPSPWLPAKSVKLTEHWSHDPQQLTAGEPVTRRITLTADGLSKSQLPPVPLSEPDGFSSYRNQAQTQENRTDSGITSTRTETIAIVPNRDGRYTLPPVKMQWFNTQTGELETARLPEREVQVSLPAGGLPTGNQTTTSDGEGRIKPYSGEMTRTVVKAPLWLWITQALTAAGLVIMIGLYWRERRKQRRPAQHGDTDVNHWKALKRASANHDYRALRQNLLAWASEHWGKPVTRLDEIAAQSDDPDLARRLRALDAAIYSPHGAEQVEPGKILQSVQALRVGKRDARADSLPPL